MFHPNDKPMERGWVGKVEGDRVIHLAAQTLQSFFLGGGGAREHAEYRLADVTLLVPVLYPPAVRVFSDGSSFEFANPAAVYGPGAVATRPPGVADLTLLPRLAVVVGAEGAIGGFSLYADWRASGHMPPKDRDFCGVLGPVVTTPDELDDLASELVVRVAGEERLRARAGTGWASAAVRIAAEGTTLRPGDLVVSPALGELRGLAGGASAVLDLPAVGLLETGVDE
jgi:hypothetical protein